MAEPRFQSGEDTMEYHFGRLIDHVHLVVRDLETSKTFYRGVLRALGRDLSGEGEGYFFSDELFVTPGDAISHVHLAFQSGDREGVHRFYEAALAAGGTDNGAPGERHYHPGYYAAFVLDPDGNNIEAVHHGPATRSATSVVVTPD
jgi:catechol 2,3-dioxygenase-like lactoylglutathione lyase family enzyme